MQAGQRLALVVQVAMDCPIAGSADALKQVIDVARKQLPLVERLDQRGKVDEGIVLTVRMPKPHPSWSGATHDDVEAAHSRPAVQDRMIGCAAATGLSRPD